MIGHLVARAKQQQLFADVPRVNLAPQPKPRSVPVHDVRHQVYLPPPGMIVAQFLGRVIR